MLYKLADERFDGIPTMNPGQNCQDCHARGGNAYRLQWAVAGTVYAALGILIVIHVRNRIGLLLIGEGAGLAVI